MEAVGTAGVKRYASLRWRNIPSGITQALLMHALQLRRSYREVFILCDLQQHSVAEAAEILASTPRAVRKRLHEARREMKEVVARICAQTYGASHGALLTLEDVVASCSLPRAESSGMTSMQASSPRANAARV